jgi:hypothetical protein
MLSKLTDYHNQQNVTISLLANKAKAHTFNSDMLADEGGDKKGFNLLVTEFYI